MYHVFLNNNILQVALGTVSCLFSPAVSLSCVFIIEARPWYACANHMLSSAGLIVPFDLLTNFDEEEQGFRHIEEESAILGFHSIQILKLPKNGQTIFLCYIVHCAFPYCMYDKLQYYNKKQCVTQILLAVLS